MEMSNICTSPLIDHKLRCTDNRTERQMSEKNNDFPFQRKEGVVVWRGRRWGVREVGCQGGGCGSRYADMICTRNETVLPVMSAKMS